MTFRDTWRAVTLKRLPQWLVSSSHGVWQVTEHNRDWVPYSVAHAREVGAPATACGQYAVGWQLFWDLPFDPARSGVCEMCAAVVSEHDRDE